MEEHSSTTTAPKAPKRGRPTCCTEENLEKILTVIREDGVSDSYVALFGNMSPATLSRWKREEPHIVFRLEQARAEFERDRRAALRTAKLKNGLPNWRAQVYLLQLACPDIYGYPPGSKAKREKRVAPPSFDQGEDAWENLPADDQTAAPIQEPRSSAAHPHPPNAAEPQPRSPDSRYQTPFGNALADRNSVSDGGGVCGWGDGERTKPDLASRKIVENVFVVSGIEPHPQNARGTDSAAGGFASDPADSPQTYSEDGVQNLQKPPPDRPHRSHQSYPSHPTDHSRSKPIASRPTLVVQPEIYSEAAVQNLQKPAPAHPPEAHEPHGPDQSDPSHAAAIPRSAFRLPRLQAAFKNLHQALKPKPSAARAPTPANSEADSLWLRPIVNPPSWWANPPPLESTRADPSDAYPFWF
jgi:hypothetical protein